MFNLHFLHEKSVCSECKNKWRMGWHLSNQWVKSVHHRLHKKRSPSNKGKHVTHINPTGRVVNIDYCIHNFPCRLTILHWIRSNNIMINNINNKYLRRSAWDPSQIQPANDDIEKSPRIKKYQNKKQLQEKFPYLPQHLLIETENTHCHDVAVT